MILPGKKRVRLYQEAVDRTSWRLTHDLLSDTGSGLVPGLVMAFAVVMIGLGCAVKAFEAANPRLSYPASPLALEAESDDAGRGIWFSMSALGENIHVTTDEKKTFEWPLDPEEALESKGYREFREFLDARRKRIVEDMVLSMDRDSIEAKARTIVALDETLTYAHFKPVMLALANAGIRSYGFETRSDGE